MLRIAINGFGRIGRTTFKAGFGRKGLEFVAVNDLMSPQVLAHLLKYDSVFRKWERQVSYDDKHIIVDGKKIPVLAEREPAKLPWKDLKVDVVIESTGRFTNKETASAHLTAGASRVVVSAPAKETPTYLEGVNADKMRRGDVVINNASCTTNAISPVAAIMHANFGVRKGMMSTVHAVTAEQNLVDGPPPALHPDLRRARSALVNIVPTSTGAAKATTEAIPELKGLFDGIAIRVPVIDVSLADFTFVIKKKTTLEEVNETFKKAAKNSLYKDIIAVTEEPLVSSDFIGSTYSAVIDLPFTRVVDGDLVKVLAWYDNEWGYSYRLIEMAERAGKQIKS
jgi:glyceraldehyde 3-phosphate dehydrogenase